MKKFIPTQLKESVETLIAARANEAAVSMVVLAYQGKVLRELKPTNNDGEIITDPGKAWTMDDEQFATYIDLLEEQKTAHGYFGYDYGVCPMLVAQKKVRKAERAVLSASIHIPGVNVSFNTITKLQQRRKALNLLVGLYHSAK